MVNPTTPTQADLILAELQRQSGQWVAMPELWRVSGAFAVHSRISDLRHQGHVIDQKCEGDKPRKSFYRLVQPLPIDASGQFRLTLS